MLSGPTSRTLPSRPITVQYIAPRLSIARCRCRRVELKRSRPYIVPPRPWSGANVSPCGVGWELKVPTHRNSSCSPAETGETESVASNPPLHVPVFARTPEGVCAAHNGQFSCQLLIEPTRRRSCWPLTSPPEPATDDEYSNPPQQKTETLKGKLHSHQ